VRPTQIYNASISRVGLTGWLLVFSLLSAAWADDAALEIIQLHNRPAAELLPLLQPFVAKDGVLEATDNKLLVRTIPANLAELRKLITQLDAPRRELLISVKLLSGESTRNNGLSLQGGNDQSPQAKIWSTEKRDDADRLQQVRVMEGEYASIDVGRQIPISDFEVKRSRHGASIKQKTRYVGATTGFYATPHVNGDMVSVDITPYQTTVKGNASPPTFNVQALHTAVTGKLGEWMLIGASSSNTEVLDSNVISHSTSQRGEQDRQILLQVKLAP